MALIFHNKYLNDLFIIIIINSIIMYFLIVILLIFKYLHLQKFFRYETFDLASESPWQ